MMLSMLFEICMHPADRHVWLDYGMFEIIP